MASATHETGHRMTQRIWLWLLALVLVAAQTLGLLHRIAHTPTAYGAATQSQGIDSSGDARGWVKDFFAGHDGDPSCRLFDQLNAGGVLPDLPVLAPPPSLPLHFLSWFQGETLACSATLFDARGPPALR